MWDRAVRLCHILLILGVINAYVSYKTHHMTWHMWNGYAVLAVLALRIMWGFFGSPNARFLSYFVSPRRVWDYIRRWKIQAVPLGHNPVGGYAVFALLGALLLQGTTGLFATTDALANGPLYDYVSYDTGEFLTDVHKTAFFYVLLPLIGVHIAAVFIYWRFKRANLVTPMITGYKDSD